MDRIRKRVSVTAAGIAALLFGMPWAQAGAVYGPWCFDALIGARQTKVYRQSFRGGELAKVEAFGDGDIDIYVRDAQGRLVVSDNLEDDEPLVLWTPPATQMYTIEVVNCENYVVDFHYDTN